MFPWPQFLTYVLVTAGTPGPNTLMSMGNGSRLGLGRWCVALRERYHAEACNGMNYLRAAEGTTDPCLERMLTELGEEFYRQADALLCLLQRSL